MGQPWEYNRKPIGLACANGGLYLAVQDLCYAPSADAFNDEPNASVSMSTDQGVTWQKTSAPTFPNWAFTTVFLLDFGRDGANALPALGPEEGRYIYA